MRVAVIGSNGQLGSDLCRAFTQAGDEVAPLNHGDVEVSDLDSVRRVLSELDTELVVNTAALHHLPRCEERPEQAFAVNALGARNVAMVAAEHDVPLLFVSTDYVFDGSSRQPYREEDLPAPVNVYGNTKLAGEHFTRFVTPRHFIVRTSGLYGHHPCRGKGRNFVELMLELARERDEVRVVDDEVLTPTSTADLSRQIVDLTRTEAYGLYHATAAGSCSWHAFAAKIFELAGAEVELKVADPGEFPVSVARPKYSVLANARLASLGIDVMRPWEEALRDYLAGRVTVAPSARSATVGDRA